jgi:hypothetical protein
MHFIPASAGSCSPSVVVARLACRHRVVPSQLSSGPLGKTVVWVNSRPVETSVA